MKLKLLVWTLILGMLLAGCGNEKAAVTKEIDDNKNTEVVVDTKSKDQKQTYDFSNEMGDFKILGVYVNENSSEEDASLDVDFNGFKINVLPSLVEVKLSDDAKIMNEEYAGKDTINAIMLTMQTENTLTDDVDYNGNITLVTDTGEQLTADSGILSENPVVQTYHGKVKAEGFDVISLNTEKLPKNLNLIMNPPDKLTEDAYTGEGTMGEEKRIEFKEYVPYEK